MIPSNSFQIYFYGNNNSKNSLSSDFEALFIKRVEVKAILELYLRKRNIKYIHQQLPFSDSRVIW